MGRSNGTFSVAAAVAAYGSYSINIPQLPLDFAPESRESRDSLLVFIAFQCKLYEERFRVAFTWEQNWHEIFREENILMFNLVI